MDAIMLQEKLVERLLCPRVRTARQKVKKVGFLGENGQNNRQKEWRNIRKIQNTMKSKDTEFRETL